VLSAVPRRSTALKGDEGHLIEGSKLIGLTIDGLIALTNERTKEIVDIILQKLLAWLKIDYQV
jgi:hypothetical protein